MGMTGNINQKFKRLSGKLATKSMAGSINWENRANVTIKILTKVTGSEVSPFFCI